MKIKKLISKFNKHSSFYIGLLILLIAVIIFIFQYSKSHNNIKKIDFNKKQDQIISQADLNLLAGQNQEQAGEVKRVKPIDTTDHIFGDLSAPVKIIIYSDFQCPYCAEYYSTIEQAKKEFGNKLVIAFRHFPMAKIHPLAMTAAIASECAAEQGNFWQMYDKLFADNSENKFSVDQFKLDAANLNLDKNKFEQCLLSSKYQNKVQAQADEAKGFNVNGTPTTFINDRIVIGANPFNDSTASDGTKIEGLKSIISKLLIK